MIDKSKSVLLIGSDGFLGNWFKDILTENGNELLCYDIQNGNDICKPLKLKRYDYVINCAGIASPEKYMEKPIETMDVSYIGTKNVLDYCVDNEVESVLMFSSSEVYGTPEPNSIPTKEDYIGTIPTRSSRSCYDIGKQVLETLCYIYYNKHNLPVKVVRPFNFYGPYMGINDNRVLSNWMRSYLKDDDIMVYGDGNQTRTFCYVEDGIDMCLSVLVNGKNGEIYNTGNPTPELTMKELAEIFCNTLDYNDRYIIRDYPNFYPKDEPLRRCPNIDKVVKDTGVQPKTTLKVGLKKMLEYFREVEND
jgi:UDP-glucuronate decarboxylase